MPRGDPFAHRIVRGARRRLATSQLCCERIALSAFRRRRQPRSRILCYHSIGTREWGVNDVSPARFRRQLSLALEQGYEFVHAHQLAASTGKERELAITFDDGLRSVATNGAPVLAELGIPWTLFVVSDWADGLHPTQAERLLDWSEIEALAETGVRIGSHSVTHPEFRGLGRDDVAAELVRSRAVIGQRIGIEPDEFAIPFGHSRSWIDSSAVAAREAGYATVYAQSEDRRPAGTVARTFVTRYDRAPLFRAALGGAFDRWEEAY